MNGGVRLDGFDELRAALLQLPIELTAEASAIVIAHGQQAQHEIESGYPEGHTGNLRRGVKIEQSSSRLSAKAIVRSTARHASIFEKGSKQRHTLKGANRGAMPVAPEAAQMIPKVIRIRRKMTDALIEMVRSAGLQVQQ